MVFIRVNVAMVQTLCEQILFQHETTPYCDLLSLFLVKNVDIGHSLSRDFHLFRITLN